jgi:hypothetical protein
MSQNKFILTFDVGIKNLAYCIVNCDKNEKVSLIEKVNIINWDIIDVSYRALYCKEIKNKRAICNCISKYYSLIDETKSHDDTENLIGYCKSHAKIIQGNNKIYQKNNKNKKNKKSIKNNIKKDEEDHKVNNIDKHNIINNENIYDKNPDKQIKLYKISSNPVYTNNFNYQMDRLLQALVLFYDNIILKPYNISNGKLEYINNLEILIENQPVHKNPIMKSISIAIYTFFTLKKIIEPNVVNSVNFINATVKTKDIFITKLSNILDIKSNIVKFKNYDNRKNFSIDITNQLVNKLPININNIICSSNYVLAKKKDDLADTLIYVIYSLLLE